MAWNDILDPKNGYIKDDTITIEVDISATTPTGDLWDSRIHMGNHIMFYFLIRMYIIDMNRI